MNGFPFLAFTMSLCCNKTVFHICDFTCYHPTICSNVHSDQTAFWFEMIKHTVLPLYEQFMPEGYSGKPLRRGLFFMKHHRGQKIIIIIESIFNKHFNKDFLISSIFPDWSAVMLALCVKLGGRTIAINRAVIKIFVLNLHLTTSLFVLSQSWTEQQPYNWGKLYSLADYGITDIQIKLFLSAYKPLFRTTVFSQLQYVVFLLDLTDSVVAVKIDEHLLL